LNAISKYLTRHLYLLAVFSLLVCAVLVAALGFLHSETTPPPSTSLELANGSSVPKPNPSSSPISSPVPFSSTNVALNKPATAAAIEAASTPATTSIPESAPTVAPTTQVASSPSGQAMPVGNIPGWRQIFADDFTTNAPVGGFPGAAYSSRWDAYADGWDDTSGNGTYMPSKVLSVQNGMLDYYIHTENGVHMIAAPLPQIAERTYGRYEVRFRADSLQGYKTAWLLWPDSEKWPADGEIDFSAGDLNGDISAYMHYADPQGGQDDFETGTAFGGLWHTAATEWTAGKVTFYLDGRLVGTSADRVPSNPLHWILKSETSSDVHPDDSTAGHIQIDWVVAYAPSIQVAFFPSGQAMPVGNIPGWRQIFADDFTTNARLGSFPGVAYSSNWSTYPDRRHDTSGNGTYMPSKVLSVQNGMLDYYIHTENGVHMVAAPVPQIAQRTYGRYELRFRADSLQGYKTAWLLWPDSELWPADGEIDFPEGGLDSNIAAYMHYADPQGGQDDFETGTAFSGTWHTAGTEWNAGRVTFYLDGKLLGTSTTKVPSKPMHWVLQSETSLSGAHPDDATAGHIQIDWVVAYAPE